MSRQMVPSELCLHVQTACIWEAMARKVGNVHRHRDFDGTTLADFLLSAAAIAPVFDVPRSVGQLVFDAVAATQAAVGQNTNLGIILALAPLARCPRESSPREGIGEVLNSLTIEDTRNVYRAIRLAQPGGLGQADQQDVHDEPTVTLREAMAFAADRDRIARLYTTNYREVFEFGLPTFTASFHKFGRIEPAVIDLQLQWLAHEPDTLIARKKGLEAAESVRQQAGLVLEAGGVNSPSGREAAKAFDTLLRSDGHALNPGTTADLIAAVLFAALRERIVSTRDPFPWQTEDWL